MTITQANQPLAPRPHDYSRATFRANHDYPKTSRNATKIVTAAGCAEY